MRSSVDTLMGKVSTLSQANSVAGKKVFDGHFWITPRNKWVGPVTSPQVSVITGCTRRASSSMITSNSSHVQ